MNSLHEDLLRLVEDGLVVAKRHPETPWTLFKYHNKVFYDNLWHVSDALLEARGIVIADDGEIIQRPFHKIFNVGENGTQKPFDKVSKPIRKVNGFMCAVTYYKPHDSFIVTTTGSFKSPFVELAKSYIWDLEWEKIPSEDRKSFTFLFEICDCEDPHIVDEEDGAYLLSVRHKESGDYLPQPTVLDVSKHLGCNYADDNSLDINEGVVYYSLLGTPLAKTKTPHYLSKKALMRMGKKQVRIMYENPVEFRKRLDEEFYSLHQYLLDTYTQEEYSGLTEQQRRQLIEEYFHA